MVNEQLKQFADIVKDMRDAQKEYFRTRSVDALNLSKQREKMVDLVIEEILKLDTQQKLF